MGWLTAAVDTEPGATSHREEVHSSYAELRMPDHLAKHPNIAPVQRSLHRRLQLVRQDRDGHHPRTRRSSLQEKHWHLWHMQVFFCLLRWIERPFSDYVKGRTNTGMSGNDGENMCKPNCSELFLTNDSRSIMESSFTP